MFINIRALADLSAQVPPLTEAAHLVLYDGVCGLCSRLLQFLVTHDQRGVFAFASLQSATGRAVVERLGDDPVDLTSFYVLANYRTRHSRIFARSNAALFVAGHLGWPWKGAVIARFLPGAVLDRAYNVVARNRYRLFGRFEQCLAPHPQFRGRFIE
jgi:predicted DCC family thiol-disulfide oxidoreductase YuxK